ncbi:MAG: KEOPS complex subunit Pcc1 [Halobacteriaceae archaeon]
MPVATIETPVAASSLVAAAVSPDNTTEMQTDVEDGVVVTTIDREDTGGLRATATDYIANIDVAMRVVQSVDQHTNSNHE